MEPPQLKRLAEQLGRLAVALR
jgi:hypothetical protein